MSLSIVAGASWLKAIGKFAPALKAVKTVRNYITGRSFTVHEFFQKVGLGSNKKDFNDIYYRALAKLNTHPDVVKVFENKMIMSYFQDSFRGLITMEDFLLHIDAHLQDNPDLSSLWPSIRQDIDELMALFLQTIFEDMDPGTQYLVEQIHGIKTDTEQLFRAVETVVEMLNVIESRMPAELSAGQAAQMSQEDFEDNIDPILEQLAQKRNRAAIELLETFKVRKIDKLTQEQLFKINFAIGQAHLELGNDREAAAIFVTLPDMLPTNPDALGVAAIGYALQDERKLAQHYAEKGLRISPGLPAAVVALINTLQPGTSRQEFDDILKHADQTNPMIALNAAEWLTKEPGNYQDAFQILESANVREGTLAWAEKLERMAILNGKIAAADFAASGGLISEEIWQKLVSAEQWLTEARDYYIDTDLRRIKWAITANRGVIRKMAGNYEGARADLLVAFDEQKNFFLYHHLLVMDMEQGIVNLKLIQEARASLALNKEQEEELFMMELNGLLEAKNHQEALRLLGEKKCVEVDEDTICKLDFFRSLALCQAGNVNEALKIAKDTADKYPLNPQIAHRTADFAIMVKDEKVAHEYATRAAKALGQGPDNNILLAVVELCFRLRHYQEVVDILNKPKFTDRWNRYIEYLVPSLQEVGLQGEAVEIVEKFYDPEKPIAFCCQVLIVADEGACDYQRALSISQNAIKHFPEDPFFHGKELAYYIRSNDQSSRDRKLQELVASNWTVDRRMQALFIGTVSAGYAHYLSGLNMALQMRNERQDELTSHHGYINFVEGLNRNGFTGIFESSVSPQHGVQLENADGDNITVTIDDSGTVLNAVSSSSEIAQALLNQRIGAEVMLDGKHFKITRIYSRFDVAFWDSKVRNNNVPSN